MRLKRGTDLTSFLHAVQTCQDDVWFISGKGDRLDLKSALSRFLFVTAQNSRELMNNSAVECSDSTDLDRLKAYLEA